MRQIIWPVNGLLVAFIIFTIIQTSNTVIVRSSDRSGRSGFRVELSDYEFRPVEHPEEAALSYELLFINETDQIIEIQFYTDDIQGMDNLGNNYSDYYAVGREWYEQVGINECTWDTPPQYETLKTLVLYPDTPVEMKLYLNSTALLSDCFEQGLYRSRVSSNTTHIVVTLSHLSYIQEGQVHELYNLEWRLTQ